MITSEVTQQKKIYFYAPDKNTHSFFEQKRENIIKARSDNFTAWIVGTYLQIKKTGIACEITDHIPQQGIMIADRDTLGNKYTYLNKVMLICTKGDREFHPSAHLHVVHNPTESQNAHNNLWKPYYIPHWSQPGLVARSMNRGFLVENVGFIGTRSNLAKDFYSEEWSQALCNLGCNWMPIFDSKKWSDYSNIDVIVAVRDFEKRLHMHKPASKLINSWRAAVPAILAPESAFTSMRNSELDFLIVNSIEETIDSVKKLKNNPRLYQLMVTNGLERAQEFSDEKLTEYWINFFLNLVFPEYEKWIEISETSKYLLFMRRYSRLKMDRMKNRLFRGQAEIRVK